MRPIIQVFLSDAGDVTYELHGSTLSTVQYGEILMAIGRQVAVMMHEAGGFSQEKAMSQIVCSMMNELQSPTAVVVQGKAH
jgi:hypothetical protein